MDFTFVSLGLLDRDKVKNTEDLPAARRQMDEREAAEACAAMELEDSRRIYKNYFDRIRRIQPENQRR